VTGADRRSPMPMVKLASSGGGTAVFFHVRALPRGVLPR